MLFVKAKTITLKDFLKEFMKPLVMGLEDFWKLILEKKHLQKQVW